jgi:hypothetical protein
MIWKTYFSSIFSISFHNFFLYFPYLFTIRLCLSSIFSKSFHYFLPYFPYHFTIFFCIFQIISLFNLSLKIWKKSKSNSEKIGKIWKKGKLNSEKIWKIQKKSRLNSEKIWKIQEKIVKWYGKYGSNVKWYGPIISQFSSVFSKSFHYSTYLSSIFSISFHISTCLSSIFSISFHISSIFSISFHNFLLYFSNLFTIQLIFRMALSMYESLIYVVSLERSV